MVPRPPYDSKYLDRKSDFWPNLKWSNALQCLKYKNKVKINRQGNVKDLKPYKFNNASWSACIAFDLWHVTQKEVKDSETGQTINQESKFIAVHYVFVPFSVGITKPNYSQV